MREALAIAKAGITRIKLGQIGVSEAIKRDLLDAKAREKALEAAADQLRAEFLQASKMRTCRAWWFSWQATTRNAGTGGGAGGGLRPFHYEGPTFIHIELLLT